MSIDNKGHWPYTVSPGDVLEGKSGALRVVRKVTNGASGFTTYVTFAIMRCSWTRRPYTVMNYIDLKAHGFRPTGIRVKLTTKMDKELTKDILDKNRRKLYCWDVVGVMP